MIYCSDSHILLSIWKKPLVRNFNNFNSFIYIAVEVWSHINCINSLLVAVDTNLGQNHLVCTLVVCKLGLVFLPRESHFLTIGQAMACFCTNPPKVGFLWGSQHIFFLLYVCLLTYLLTMSISQFFYSSLSLKCKTFPIANNFFWHTINNRNLSKDMQGTFVTYKPSMFIWTIKSPISTTSLLF